MIKVYASAVAIVIALTAFNAPSTVEASSNTFADRNNTLAMLVAAE